MTAVMSTLLLETQEAPLLDQIHYVPRHLSYRYAAYKVLRG